MNVGKIIIMVVEKIEMIAIYANHWVLCMVPNRYSISINSLLRKQTDLNCIGLERVLF
jgi:hypothetical protein